MQISSYIMSTVKNDDPRYSDLYVFHGKSAYQAAVEQGFEGTEEEWLASLCELRFGTLSTFSDTLDSLLYIDTEKDMLYRYDLSSASYKQIGVPLGETKFTAYRGDRGKIAYEHSQTNHDFLYRKGGGMTGDISSMNITPKEDNKYTLGTSALRYSAIYATTFHGALSGNATSANSAAKLTKAVNINGTSFDGSTTITTAHWGTARNISITDASKTNTGTAVSVNGSSAVTLLLPDTIKATSFVGALSGNAATASKWASARTITVTGSVTGSVSIDGSGNVTLSTSTNHTHSYLPLSGGTLTGTLTARAINPSANNTYSLGTSSMKWSAIYATTFHGALSGNATSANSAAKAAQLTNARTIAIGGKATGTATSFDGTANITIPITKIDPSGITQSASYRLVTDTQISAWNAKPTQAELNSAIAGLVNSSPELLNTLDELAAALNDDPNFATTMTNALATKLPLTGGTLTGNLNIKGGLSVSPTGSNVEGGEISLAAPSNNTAANGIVLDVYSGVFRIFGIPSANGTTKTGTGTPLSIDPYSKTVNGGYTFDGNLTGNANSATVAAKLGRHGNVNEQMTFYWSGQGGQPSWVWGGEDGVNMYVYNPLNFHVAYSDNAGAAGTSQWLTPNGNLVYGASGMQYFNLSMSAGSVATENQAPTADWYHVIRMNHANGSGYYVDLAFCFHSNIMAYRRIASGVSHGWVTLLDSSNWGNYCAPAYHEHGQYYQYGSEMTGQYHVGAKDPFIYTADGYNINFRYRTSSTAEYSYTSVRDIITMINNRINSTTTDPGAGVATSYPENTLLVVYTES